MMGQINKTDKLDTHGLNRLPRNGTLPTVWIPPGNLRELRELTRTRVVLVAQRTRWKNRLTATLAKWGLPASEYSDRYGKKAREELEQRLERLPEQTRWATRQMLVQWDGLNAQVKEFEKRLEELVEVTPAMQLLETLPGIAVILSATIARWRLGISGASAMRKSWRRIPGRCRGCIPAEGTRATGGPGRM